MLGKNIDISIDAFRIQSSISLTRFSGQNCINLWGRQIIGRNDICNITDDGIDARK